jgi:hypothetical protein
VTDRWGVPRWWQRLAATRLLEHDDGGQLVWEEWLLSTARQVGKSWLLRGLAGWRLEQGARFGGAQLVMHTGKDLPVCREVQRPMRIWARQHRDEGWDGKEANGKEEVSAPDGGRWLVRAQDAVYGYAAGLALVDEGWAVMPQVVSEGLEPTLAETPSGQLGLVSTAHRRATGLLLRRREAAIAQLGAPVGSLMLEWSAPADAELADVAGWRQASPHWSARRERLVARALERALEGVSDDPDEPDPVESFRAQWLNVWPGELGVRAGAASRLVDEQVWLGAADLEAVAEGPLTVVLEDRTGLGAAAVVCGATPDGRWLLWGRLFGSRAEAVGWCALLLDGNRGGRLLTPLVGDESLAGFPAPVSRPGAGQVPQGLSKLRELLGSGRLVHDGGAELTGQMVGALVAERVPGLVVMSSGRSDLVRCGALAVAAAAAAPAPRPGWVMV